MNRRRHVQHLFSAYIDGDLPPARTRAVAAHLATCPACAWELEQWRAVLRLVSYHAAVACPIDCAEAVLQQIASQRLSAAVMSCPSAPGKLRIPHPSSLGRPLVLASILVLLGSGTWLWSIRAAERAVPGRPAQIVTAGSGARALVSLTPGTVSGKEGTATLVRSTTQLAPDAVRLAPGMAVPVHAPARLEEAFGRSDSLILAADFAEDDR